MGEVIAIQESLSPDPGSLVLSSSYLRCSLLRRSGPSFLIAAIQLDILSLAMLVVLDQGSWAAMPTMICEKRRDTLKLRQGSQS